MYSSAEISELEEAFFRMTQEAGELLSDNIQDKTIHECIVLVGWNLDQRDDPAAADAVEWRLYDGEQAYAPEETSMVFNFAVNNFTFLQYSEDNYFIIDQRGHDTWIKGEASTFLRENDPRLLLNTIVSNMSSEFKSPWRMGRALMVTMLSAPSVWVFCSTSSP